MNGSMNEMPSTDDGASDDDDSQFQVLLQSDGMGLLIRLFFWFYLYTVERVGEEDVKLFEDLYVISL